MLGTVINLNVEKNFGFIRPDIGEGKNLFFSPRALSKELTFDQTLLFREVSFDESHDREGRKKAVNVRPAR